MRDRNDVTAYTTPPTHTVEVCLWLNLILNSYSWAKFIYSFNWSYLFALDWTRWRNIHQNPQLKSFPPTVLSGRLSLWMLVNKQRCSYYCPKSLNIWFGIQLGTNCDFNLPHEFAFCSGWNFSIKYNLVVCAYECWLASLRVARTQRVKLITWRKSAGWHLAPNFACLPGGSAGKHKNTYSETAEK